MYMSAIAANNKLRFSATLCGCFAIMTYAITPSPKECRNIVNPLSFVIL